MLNRCRTVAVVGLALLGVVAGCSSSPGRKVRHDLTPELKTVHQRPADVDNTVWHTWNADWRMMKADLLRAGHLDRPSRLAPVPVPH